MASSGARKVYEAAKDAVERVVGSGPTEKERQMDSYRVDPSKANDSVVTADWGVPISNTTSSLKAGDHGPVLLEDFHFREKMTRFDHERNPPRVVHARGSGAYGYFQMYESLRDYTCARVLTDTSLQTPTFVRFSTVLGERGSADTVRDVRGFATKFYTPEGNWDLVGNNIPVFFIQDGMQFPDIIHAARPEPHNRIPQAQTAHDNLWDFVGLTPETAHMMMWTMSDRAIPRSYRMMQGFGVNTYTLINDAGERTFVKFHWRPMLGVHSLAWDEAMKLAGQDPDFHRRDLWEAIESGSFPQYEFGVQLVPEGQEHRFDFDILDDTKIIPEELVPVRWVGKMTLNRNPDEFYPETEQVAFCVQHVVRGIGFSDDPMLQTRLFSYLDTQLLRLGGPNFQGFSSISDGAALTAKGPFFVGMSQGDAVFGVPCVVAHLRLPLAEIPINQPLCPVMNNNRDGLHRQRITKSRFNYTPNRGGSYNTSPPEQRGYIEYAERISGMKTRLRGEKFKEHFKQATLFYNSMSDAERYHMKMAFIFELGRCEDQGVRDRAVTLFNNVDHDLACSIADGIGVERPSAPARANHGERSESLSQTRTFMHSAASRKVAILLADGYDMRQVLQLRAAIKAEGALSFIISTRRGPIRSIRGEQTDSDTPYSLEAHFTLYTSRSTFFDALLVPGGAESVQTLLQYGEAVMFINEAFKHCKPIGAVAEGINLLHAAALPPLRLAGGRTTARGETLQAGGKAAAPVSEDEVVVDQGVVTALKLPMASGLIGTMGSALERATEAPMAGGSGSSGAAASAMPNDFGTQFIHCCRQHRFWLRDVASVPA